MSDVKNEESFGSVEVLRAAVEVVVWEVESGQLLQIEQGVGDAFFLELVVAQVQGLGVGRVSNNEGRFSSSFVDATIFYGIRDTQATTKRSKFKMIAQTAQ